MGPIEQLSFAELVDAFCELSLDAHPAELERAAERLSVERRLIDILSTRTHDQEHRAAVGIPGEVAVHLLYDDHWTTASLLDLGEGGLGVRTLSPPPVGKVIDIELIAETQDSPTHLPRARVLVAWAKPRSDLGSDCGLTFVAYAEAEQRHVRRVMVELLRRLPRPITAS